MAGFAVAHEMGMPEENDEAMEARYQEALRECVGIDLTHGLAPDDEGLAERLARFATLRAEASRAAQARHAQRARDAERELHRLVAADHATHRAALRTRSREL